MPGVDVYLRDEIPIEFNLKKGRYLQEILIVAKSGKQSSLSVKLS